jgi:hypothetical protein
VLSDRSAATQRFELDSRKGPCHAQISGRCFRIFDGSADLMVPTREVLGILKLVSADAFGRNVQVACGNLEFQMKIAVFGAFFLFLVGSAAVHAAPSTFAEPVIAASPVCPLKFVATLTPDKTVLTLLREATPGSPTPMFLSAGRGYAKAAKSSCAIQITFPEPLSAARQIAIELNGSAKKHPQTTMSYVLRIDSREHRVDYARGRWVDNFGVEPQHFVVDLRAGTKAVNLTFSGVARSYADDASTFYDFENFGICFVDPDEPLLCAAKPPDDPPLTGNRP